MAVLAACSPQEPALAGSGSQVASKGGTVEDRAGLIDTLRAAGAKVEVGSPVDQPFFTVSGRVIKVSGEDVQVFEYASAAARDAEAAQVAPDGSSVGTNMVSWIAAPHFFSSGRILVIYVGDDGAVLNLLRGTLGQQFAGQ